jgi:hypothetical protein
VRPKFHHSKSASASERITLEPISF